MGKEITSLQLSDVIDLYFENFKILGHSFHSFGLLTSSNVIKIKLIEESFHNQLKKTNNNIDLDLLLKKIEREIINYSNDQSKALLSILESKKTEVIDTFSLVMDSAFYENTKRIETGLDFEKSNALFNNYFVAFGFYGENRLLTIENLLKVTILRFSAEYSQIEKRFKYISGTSKKEVPEIGQQSPPFKNNFDKAKENDVIKYFTETLVDKKHLTLPELIEYLIIAFEKKASPTERFKFKNLKTKQKIISVFYKYYKDHSENPYGEQKRYAELLGNYFEGFSTPNVMTNFGR
jgi:hypothetical protein